MTKFRIVQMRNLQYKIEGLEEGENKWHDRYGLYNSIELAKMVVGEYKLEENKRNEDRKGREILKVFTEEGIEVTGAATIS